jgi:hypothetical protein
MVPKVEDVPILFAEYHRTPHFGLAQVQRTRRRGHMTPLEVWNDMNRQRTRGVDPTWTRDRVSIPL